MGFFEILKLLFSLTPMIIDAIHAVEKIIGPGNGSTKLATVLSIVKTAADVGPGLVTQVQGVKDEVDVTKGGNVTPEHISTILAGVTGIVNTVVKAANDTGAFAKSGD